MDIEEALSEKGINKKYVAKKLGISEVTLSAYLRNPAMISIKEASIISYITEKDIDELSFKLTKKF